MKKQKEKRYSYGSVMNLVYRKYLKENKKMPKDDEVGVQCALYGILTDVFPHEVVKFGKQVFKMSGRKEKLQYTEQYNDSGVLENLVGTIFEDIVFKLNKEQCKQQLGRWTLPKESKRAGVKP